MPKVGLTMTEGTIAQWHKHEGEHVNKGDVLFTFETEKSTLEFESPYEGVLAHILAPVGQLTPCLAPVAVIEERLEIRDSRFRTGEKRREIGDWRLEIKPQSPISNNQSPISNLQSPVSPRARLRARELGIDLNTISGSGPDGVVLERDVLDYQAHATELQATNAISNLQSPISNLQSLSPARRVTAQRTAESARSAPHVTLTTEADATALVSAREQLNAELNEKVSYNALLVAIVARALKEHPQLNASWADGSVALHQAINIGVAVDTPRGLYVPVVLDATRPLAQVHRDLTDLLARTLAGSAGGDDFAGGTFTITNLGMYEIDAFTPIINQPQAAILGVGRIQGKPVARGEQVAVRQMMALSLSFDHRVVDGAPAAKFLQRVKTLIERPFALMV
ncbi:MAG: 2-oxo acid dehydrogenase subunit E2 [Chloroflexi bacterium]|nr:2-oxo acid dehydrogenase subunit E2 [Chloroflexota bacterium]